MTGDVSPAQHSPLPSRSVTPADLVKWRDAVQNAMLAIGRARLELAAADRSRLGTLLGTQEALRQVSSELHAVPPAVPFKASVPLSLTDLSTPDTRELLIALENTLAIAEKVDFSRGRTLPDSIPTTASESRGTDLASTLAKIVMRVRTEVHGARSLHE